VGRARGKKIPPNIRPKKLADRPNFGFRNFGFTNFEFATVLRSLVIISRAV
jgi:hypothetical protein